MYEVAVQVRPRCRKHVVHFQTTEGVHSINGSWFNLVFTSKINKMVDYILEQGSEVSVFVRRMLINGNAKVNGRNIGSASKCRAVMKSCYDYAWRRSKNQSPRELVKNSVHLVEV